VIGQQLFLNFQVTLKIQPRLQAILLEDFSTEDKGVRNDDQWNLIQDGRQVLAMIMNLLSLKVNSSG
jgi:hypothetical protein